MSSKVLSLSGTWKIVKDEQNCGRELGWEKQIPDVPVYDICIPGNMAQDKCYWNYAYSTVLTKYHGYVWYYRTFTPSALPGTGERARLEFDEAGYVVEVFLNGFFLGRHTQHEERFSYDITDCLREGENLIAVRCFEPSPKKSAIDGIDLVHIPNACLIHATYEYDSNGGIENEVRYLIVDTVRVSDVCIRPDAKSGDVELYVTFENAACTPQEITFTACCTEKKSGVPAAVLTQALCIPAGQSTQIFRTHIEAHKLWDVTNTALYLCQILINANPAKTMQFGFKELCLKNGFFFLNGRRIFLRCAHALPTIDTAIGMKSSGFNCMRCLSHIADPEFLDICDEIGLLVIESPRTSWGMSDHEHTREMIFASMDAMILRDRSHPCIAAYYLFNELSGFGSENRPLGENLPEAETFRHGVSYLARLRELDRDHIALLSSGRWDNFRMVGSVSNAGSDTWDYEWGAEGDETYKPREWMRNYTNSYLDIDGCGDIHPYCRLPMDEDTIRWFRTLGHDTRPVFISEMGNGSQSDPVRQLLEADAAGIPQDNVSRAEYERLTAGLNAFMEDNGFTDLFPFPQSFCEESFRLNERQRQQVFDVIRANPMICGYSLTSWGTINEGTLESGSVLKPGQSYALQTGWAPLRWALFAPRTVYAGRPFTVEAALCNEDVLSPGAYRAEARIHSKERGVVWKHPFTAVYPSCGYGGMPPLAADVMKETVSLEEGDYTLNVKLLEGGAPFGGVLPIRAVELDDTGVCGKMVAVWALEDTTVAFLHAHGVETVDISEVRTGDDVLLLVGRLSGKDVNPDKAMAIAEAGGRVLFIRPEHFDADNCRELAAFLKQIAGQDAYCRYFFNWLYHMDTVHKEHPVFRNTGAAGINDLETWGDCCPEYLFLRMAQPDTVLAAGIGLNCQIEEQCARSQAFCEYVCGKGRIILNGFAIEPNIGKHPFADQILLNIVACYG